MGRISASQAAGLDLIDKLFFNQILVLRLFTEELVWLKDLDADLDRELTNKGITGIQRQVVRHGVLCMMEVELSESLLLLREDFPDEPRVLPDKITMQHYEELERHNLTFFKALVLVVLKKSHQCDTQVVLELSNALLGKYRKAPATVRYRLVERMFSFEFEKAPIDCFTWLAIMNVLDSKKHHGEQLEEKTRYSPAFLQRLALLCELDMQRGYVRRAKSPDGSGNLMREERIKSSPEETTKLLLLALYQKYEVVNSIASLKHRIPGVSLTELTATASIQRFFNDLNTYATRLRVFQGTLGSWIGMLCGGYVELLHHTDFKEPKEPIYSDCTEFNDGSLTQFISKRMSARGFRIGERAIYEHHRDFKETILKIVTMYYNIELSNNVAIPPDLNDIVYHGLAPHFDKLKLKPKPRRSVT